jgi:hypothetical protein
MLLLISIGIIYQTQKLNSMKSIHFLLVLLAIILSSCNAKEEISDSEKRLIIEELQSRLNDYSDAFKRKDIVGVLNFWSNTPDFAFAGDGKLITDYDSIFVPRMQNRLPKVQEVPYFDFVVERGAILSKDAVSVTSTFDWAQIETTGDTVRARGTWLFVFMKKNGQWSVVQSAGTHILY